MLEWMYYVGLQNPPPEYASLGGPEDTLSTKAVRRSVASLSSLMAVLGRLGTHPQQAGDGTMELCSLVPMKVVRSRVPETRC